MRWIYRQTRKYMEVLRMNEQAKQMRREYKRAWNRANKDKVAAAQARYWERKAAEQAQENLEKADEPQKQEA